MLKQVPNIEFSDQRWLDWNGRLCTGRAVLAHSFRLGGPIAYNQMTQRLLDSFVGQVIGPYIRTR